MRRMGWDRKGGMDLGQIIKSPAVWSRRTIHIAESSQEVFFPLLSPLPLSYRYLRKKKFLVSFSCGRAKSTYVCAYIYMYNQANFDGPV